MAQASRVSLEIFASSTPTGESHTGLVTLRKSLSSGTDTDEADLCYHEIHTIAYPSVPLELDLSDGSLVDINGDPMVMREAVAIGIVALADDSEELHELEVAFDFGAGAYAWTEPVIAGGHLSKYAPAANGYSALGAGPHIIITPLDGVNVQVQVIILGRSLS